MTVRNSSRVTMFAGVVLLAAQASGLAYAQTSTGASARSAGPAANSSDDAMEIVVTAQRRSEREVDVPSSVVVETGDALQNAGVVRFNDIGLVAPGVQIGNSGSYTQPSIRGVSTTFAAGGQETNVAVYVDGFYTSDQLSINQDLSNIQDIQILKGPQGTLYGRNATGGAILINTLTPSNTFDAHFNVSYASFDDRTFSGFVGGPIADGIYLGAAGSFRESTGWIKDSNDFAPNAPIFFIGDAQRGTQYAAPYENYSIRPKLVIEKIEGLKVILGYENTYVSDARSLAWTAVGNRANAAASYDGYPTTTAPDWTSQNFRPRVEIHTAEPNLTVEATLGSFGTLTSRSAYRWQRDFQMYDLDGAPIDPIDNPYGTSYAAELREQRRTFTQQLDLAAKPAPGFELLAGVFYYRDLFNQHAIEDLGLSFSPTYQDLTMQTKSWAAYVDGTKEIMDNLFFTVGGRYSDDEKTYTAAWVDNTGASIPGSSTIGFYPNGAPEVESRAFTPRSNLRYNLTADSNVYFSWSRGFKAATINSYAPYNLLEPEKANGFELGYKITNRRYRAEVSVFYNDVKDLQVSALSANSKAIETLIENSSGAVIKGVDALFNVTLDEHWQLQTSGAFLHARYKTFDNATDVIVDPATGLNTSIVGSWGGRQLPRAPDWTFSASVEYGQQLAGGRATTNLSGHYTSSYAPLDPSYGCAAVSTSAGVQCPAGLNTADATGRFVQGGFFQGNLEESWLDPSQHWTVTVFCNNFTDVQYKVFDQGFFYATIAGYSEPRSFGGRFGYKF